MRPLEANVAATIERHDLFRSNQTIFIALSGGADSVALLRAICALGYGVEALHCNFCLRASESDADEAFVRALCTGLGVPLRVERYDTRGYAREHGLSIEMAARELRYGWFARVRSAASPTVVAVAHNADDQIETMLLNLSMGTGLRGLSGMPYKRHDGIVRPLMDCSRSEVEAYLTELGASWREDSSNASLIYKRNLIRHRLIPLFEELNPAFRQGASRTIEHLRGAEAYYHLGLEEARAEVCQGGDRLHIPSLLSGLHPPTLIYELLTPLGFSSAQCADIASSLSTLPSGRRFLSHSHGVVRGGDYLEIYRRDEKAFEGCTIDISRAGEVDLPIGVLRWRILPSTEGLSLKCTPNEALLDWRRICTLSTKLTIRARGSGDKLYPFGMKGGKLLRRIFIDGGFSHRERTEALLLTLCDEVLWLIGRLADRRYALTDTTREVLSLSLTPHLSPS